jgi:AcrR family transcriptional regulator
MPRLPSPERRATILQAARALFTENAFAQTTMADIAAAAGVGVGSLYVYFPTKEAIAVTLVDAYFAELFETILPPLRERHGVDAVAAAIAGGLECASRNQDVLGLCRLMAPSHTNQANILLTQAIERAITQQMRDGYLRQYDPTIITQWINGQIEWAITHCLFENRGDISSYQRLLVEVIGRALGVSDTSGNAGDEVKGATSDG